VEGLEVDLPASGRDAEEVSAVRTAIADAGGEAVIAGHDVLHGGGEVGEDRPRRPHPLLEAGWTRWLTGHRVVVDELGGKQLVRLLMVPRAESCHQPAVRGLVGAGVVESHSWIVSTGWPISQQR
jgi:hypothetical protein